MEICATVPELGREGGGATVRWSQEERVEGERKDRHKGDDEREEEGRGEGEGER